MIKRGGKMAVYDVNGNAINELFNLSGGELQTAYDIDGVEIFHPYDMRIMSYNVRWFTEENQYGYIQNPPFGRNADIIGIQEYSTGTIGKIDGVSAPTYMANKGYPYQYTSTLDYNHKIVVSKIPMNDISETVYSASHETRSYQKMYFTYKGKRIALFNTHTDYQLDNYKYNQIAELVNAVAEEEYFILVGDLNTTCTDKGDTEYIKCVQPFIDNGYNVANSAVGEDLFWTFYNGKTESLSTQITPPDNIITSANIDIINVFVDTTKLNYNTGYAIDHIPLVADIVIN